jgi:3-phenylpropionate/trans-cinnamate dioxygenase ferredoxin reductase subunit
MGHVVIVGAGQAGAALAAKLRALGATHRITMIGAEPVAPYQRPPLSKAYLLGEMPLDRLMLRGPDFWAAQDIALRLGTEVSAIDRDAKTITAAHETIAYDDLVLTTGSRARRLPAAIGGALGGVYTVRDLADVDAMASEFVPGRHVLIVGGGYIGLEAAAVAAKKGLRVTLIEAAPRILQRVACSETADWFRALHRSHGVEILEGLGLDRLSGDGRVTVARLADGQEIEVDFVIVGIGIEPETTLARAAGLEIDNGIAVDSLGRTGDPAIWSAGDCASFPHRGGRMRLESVPNAIEMAEVVAANILGADQHYVPRPWFWSDQYDSKLQIAGLGTGYDRIVIRQAGAARSHWYFQGDRLLAVDAMNDPRGFMIARRLIEAGKSPDPAQISDPETDLKALL